MADVKRFTDLDVEAVRANLGAVRADVDAAARRAGRDPAEVEVVAATKYVPLEEVAALAAAGITAFGENRLQDLEVKAAAHPELTWDFIGQLQSRKVKDVLPLVRYVHSVASESVARQLATHGDARTKVLVQVDVAGEAGKAGVAPDDLEAFVASLDVEVVGLTTMPPATDDAERSRPHFAALRDLAAAHGLEHLSMGTTQDFVVAVEEGATLVRVGTRLYTR